MGSVQRLRSAGGLVFCLCDGTREEVVAAHAVWFFCLCAGIRVLPSCFKRRPCAGRHLLFFAAAKKSRQKKAAHTANSSPCLRAPNRSLTSHGNLLVPRPLPALLQYASPASRTRDPACRARCSTAAPGANCVEAVAPHAPHFGPIAHAFHHVRAPSYTTRQPTHSLPPGRHIPFAAACPSTGIRSG
jgi:hypothetical protein